MYILNKQRGEKNKLVLQYIYLYGYSQSETAKKLGIPLGTVVKGQECNIGTKENFNSYTFNGSFTSIILLITVLCQ